MVAFLGAYEVLSGFNDSKPFRLHIKRFLFRMAVVLGYGLYTVALFSVLSSLLSWTYGAVLSIFLTSLSLAVLVSNPKVASSIKKLDEVD